MSNECTRQAAGNGDCPCTYPGCTRHGNCCQCVKYHRTKDQLPACYFTPEQEKAYDRSIRFFIACRNG